MSGAAGVVATALARDLSADHALIAVDLDPVAAAGGNGDDVGRLVIPPAAAA